MAAKCSASLAASGEDVNRHLAAREGVLGLLPLVYELRHLRRAVAQRVVAKVGGAPSAPKNSALPAADSHLDAGASVALSACCKQTSVRIALSTACR